VRLLRRSRLARNGKTGRPLAQLRFYVRNADISASGDEAPQDLRDPVHHRQLLAATATPDEALAELQPSPLLAETSARLHPGPQPRQASRPLKSPSNLEGRRRPLASKRRTGHPSMCWNNWSYNNWSYP